MKFYAKVMAFVTVAAMGVSALGVSAFAENVNYYQNWTSDQGNGPGNGSTSGSQGTTNFSSTINVGTGTFNVTWNTTGSGFNNLEGVGWSTGNATRKVGYNLGVFNHTSGSKGNTRLNFYGWTRNSLIEYYVIDNWVNYAPGVSDSSYTKGSTYSSDGGNYTVYYKNMNGPNIDGSGNFKQVVSVRDSKRTAGTVTFANHVAAWKANSNTALGSSFSYQSLGIEGYESSGSANGSVWETN